MIEFRKRRIAVPLGAVALFAASLAAFIAAARASVPRQPVLADATTTIASRHTKAGVVLASSHGQVLFLFVARDGKTGCYGRCTRDWRPLRAEGRVVAKRGSGVKQRWLSTTRRRGGNLQVTYDGFPLYVNVGNKPGSLKGDGTTEFGGRWYAMPVTGVKTSP